MIYKLMLTVYDPAALAALDLFIYFFYHDHLGTGSVVVGLACLVVETILILCMWSSGFLST